MDPITLPRSPRALSPSNTQDIKPKLRPEEIERRLKEAFSYKEHGHLENAAEIYAELAEQNVAEAQCFYGVLLNHGNGVKENCEEVLRLLTEAASQGFLPANIELGKMYALGWGVDIDLLLAKDHFLKAGNDPEAQLCMVFWYPQIGEIDESQALRYFRQSAKSGNGIACTKLTEIYVKQKDYRRARSHAKQAAGLGIPNGWYSYTYLRMMGRLGAYQEIRKDTKASPDIIIQEAIYLFRRVAESGIKEGWIALKILYEVTKSSEESHSELLKLEKYYENLPHWNCHTGWSKVYNHFKQSVTDKDPMAIYNLGMMHLEGRGTVKDLVAGLAWLEEACLSGDKSARQQLQMMLAKGYAEYSAADIIACYLKATQQKEPWALYRVGNLHLQGVFGVKKDRGLALRCFDEAERLGVTKAKSQVEKILNDYEKNGVKEDSIKPESGTDYQFPFYLLDTVYTFPIQHIVAAEKKVPWSIYRLGTMHLTGCGLEKDIGRAVRRLDEAEALGIEAAKHQLNAMSSNPEYASYIVAHYQDADAQKKARVLYRLGLAHINAADQEYDFFKGLDYIEKAAERNYPGARKQLNELQKKRIAVEPKQSTKRSAASSFKEPVLGDENSFFLTDFAFDLLNSNASGTRVNAVSIEEIISAFFGADTFSWSFTFDQLIPDFLKSTPKKQ